MSADPELFIFIAAFGLTCFCFGAIVTYIAVNWGRDRQAENDDERRETAIDFSLELAQENQQLEQRMSAETPVAQPHLGLYSLDEVIAEHGFTQAEIDAAPVDDDPEAMARMVGMVDSSAGRVCEWSDDGTTLCGEPAVGSAEMLIGRPVPLCATHYQWACHGDDEGVRWCVNGGRNGGWCAVSGNDKPGETWRSAETLCGYTVLLHGDLIATAVVEWRRPDCDDCLAAWVHTPCGTRITVLDDGAEWCPTCATFIDQSADDFQGWADAVHRDEPPGPPFHHPLMGRW